MHLTSLESATELSLKGKYLGEADALFNIKIEGETWACYTVHVGHRQFTCYCDKGTATYLVDTYYDKASCVLHDWERDI